MRAGHGRGYYGEGQLAQDPQRRGSGWTKLAVVAGAGAVIWLMWPRIRRFAAGSGGGKPLDLPTTLPPSQPPYQPSYQLPQHPQVAEGYPGQHAYEDAVVASALQLQASGAKVVLAPHLAHLSPRLGSPEELAAQITPTGPSR